MTNKLILATLLLAATPACAQGQGQGGGRAMMRADSNGDGVVSREEFLAAAGARFGQMDANHDGTLSSDEMTGPGARLLARADANGDGKVSRAEYDAAVAPRFARMDTNGDGKLSADEMQALAERLRGGGGRMDAADAVAPAPGAASAHPAMSRGLMAGAPGAPGEHGHMMRADANHDGRISRDEMRAEADARFDRLDTNRDGYVDRAEAVAAHAKRQHAVGKRDGAAGIDAAQ